MTVAELKKAFRELVRKTFTRYECRQCPYEFITNLVGGLAEVDTNEGLAVAQRLRKHARLHRQMTLPLAGGSR
jgi:DNA-binding transcriptional regulator/RsmH inhibitor MraZ